MTHAELVAYFNRVEEVSRFNLAEQIATSSEKHWPANPKFFGEGLVAVFSRESGSGCSKDLDRPTQGNCTGDFGLRLHKPGPRYRVIKVGPADKPGFAWCLPADGRGYGRGGMQTDYDAHPELLAMTDASGVPLWQTFAGSIELGAIVLEQCFKSMCLHKPEVLISCAFASYNTGPMNAFKGYQESGDPDHYTTGRDYSKDVLARRLKLFGTAEPLDPLLPVK